MIQLNNSLRRIFRRYINVRSGANVLAIQVPMDCDIVAFRKLWRQPNVNHGDWIVKPDPITGNRARTHMTNEHFNKIYRKPY